MDFHLIKKNNIWRLEQNQISSILTFQQVITDFRNHFNFSSQQSQIKQNFTHKQFSFFQATKYNTYSTKIHPYASSFDIHNKFIQLSRFLPSSPTFNSNSGT